MVDYIFVILKNWVERGLHSLACLRLCNQHHIVKNDNIGSLANNVEVHYVCVDGCVVYVSL